MTVGAYEWWTTDDGADANCWWDGGEWAPLDISINEGQGFYVYANDADLKLQCAGSVKLTAYETNLNKGYNIVGNSSPIDIDIQKITLVGETVSGSGANFICLLNEQGMTVGAYEWWTTDDGADANCWWDGGEWAPLEATIYAGEGLYVYAEDNGLKFVVPSALGK